MALMKVIEIMASSTSSWDEAAQNAVQQASKTVKNIRSVYIKEQTATVNNNNIGEYRVTAKITFEVA